MSCFQPRWVRYLTQRLAVSVVQHGPPLLGQRGKLPGSLSAQGPAAACGGSVALRAYSTDSTSSVGAGTGVVVGFGRQGWPLVRLEGAENTEGAQGAEGAERPVILVDPGDAVLVRGQMLKLEDGKISEVFEGSRKKKCIHPTRVAGLCKTCPRRKGKLSRCFKIPSVEVKIRVVADSLCLVWVSKNMFRSILLRLRNCHEVLGISPQASRQELKHRYHELARSLHPDVSSGEVRPGARFAELREAYEACLRLARPRRQGRPGSPMSSGAASFTTAASGNGNGKGNQQSGNGAPFGGFPTTPPHLRTTFPGAWSSNFRPKALNGGSYQGQPWKWRIRGPLTLSAQRKGSFTMRR